MIVFRRDYLAIYRAALLKARLVNEGNEVEFAVKAATNAALQDAADNCIELGVKRTIQNMIEE